MSNDQIIKNIIKEARKINSKTFTITRNTLLAFCLYFRDGIQFRELKAGLGLSDSKLNSNLRFLIKSGYLLEGKTIIDKKHISFYMITPEGKNELRKMLDWMEYIKKLIEEDRYEKEF